MDPGVIGINRLALSQRSKDSSMKLHILLIRLFAVNKCLWIISDLCQTKHNWTKDALFLIILMHTIQVCANSLGLCDITNWKLDESLYPYTFCSKDMTEEQWRLVCWTDRKQTIKAWFIFAEGRLNNMRCKSVTRVFCVTDRAKALGS